MIKKKVLPILLAAAMICCMTPAAAFAAGTGIYDVKTQSELSAALGRKDSVYTIRLTADIDYNAGIVVTGKTITFDLNGHTLNVANSAGSGLEVGSGGVVDMKGKGEFNVASSADYDSVERYYGVYAHDGGQAKVTSATQTGTEGVGAFAMVKGINSVSCITVTGDVNGSEIGAFADIGGRVIVGGNAEGGHCAASAWSDGTLLEVAGNVTVTGNDGAAQGISAQGGSIVRVTGDVTAKYGSAEYFGVVCAGSTVWVGGSVTAGEAGVVVGLNRSFDVTIDGTVTAPTYIEMEDNTGNQYFKYTDGTIGTGDDKGYMIYSKGNNTIRVKIKDAAAQPAKAAVYTAGTPEELSSALGRKDSVYTIRLTADIDYNTGITVAGKAITFDLNGHTLNVASKTGHGLEAGKGGVVDITGTGALNAESSAKTGDDDYMGYSAVYAHDGGRAKVTGAKSTARNGTGARADGSGSLIELTGGAEAADSKFEAVLASNEGKVIVGGSVKGGYFGVTASHYGYVEVAGNVTADAEAVFAGFDGTAYVKGNVTATDEYGAGVHVNGVGLATVDGQIIAPIYIKMDVNHNVDAYEGVPGTGADAGYMVYTMVYSYGTSVARIKMRDTADAGTPEELSAALDALQGGGTIRLTADIDYSTDIVVTGRSITFDFNGHTLNVANSKGYGLIVGSGGVVDMTGSGAFNVMSSSNESVNYCGVYAYDGGRAEVTSATKTGECGFGAYAKGEGSCIDVKDDVKSPGRAAFADSGGHITVGGDAEGATGAYASRAGSLVEVAGNVKATGDNGEAGAYAVEGGTVRVAGNASGNYAGVRCDGGTAWVGGNVTSENIGVAVGRTTTQACGSVTIDGTITAPVYIQMPSESNKPVTFLTAGDGVKGTGDDKGYLVYARVENIVRVKIESEVPGPAALVGIGISVYPLSDTQVEMEKEAVDITMQDGRTFVTCESWLHNTGKAASLPVGFSAQYIGADESETSYSLIPIHWFRTYVNGKRVGVSLKKGHEPEESDAAGLYDPERYTWRMRFAAGERIKLVNKYWFADPSGRRENIRYIIRGGAAWVELVGKLTVQLRLKDFDMQNTVLRGMQPAYIKEDGTIVWEAENIEPTQDIVLYRKSPDVSCENPFSASDDDFLPYQKLTLRMLHSFRAREYNGTTWWGNLMFRRFGDKQSSQLYYCMGVSYYKLGHNEKALDMFSRIRGNDELYRKMSAYYKALICKKAGDDTGYQSYMDSVRQYLSGIPESEMPWGAYWLKSRLEDIAK